MRKDDYTLKKDFDDYYTEGLACWSTAYEEMNIDVRMFLGDQFSDTDKALLAEEGRSAYIYNYLQRNINLVTGYQRKNRLGFGIDPQSGEDMQVADVLEDLLIWQAQKSNFYNVFSDGFEEAAITGCSMLSFGIDYSKDPINGDIICRAEPFESFMIDPHFTQMDLSDCRFFMRRKYVDKAQAQQLLPMAKKDIDSLVPGVPDNKFSYMSYSQNRYENTLYALDEMYTSVSKKVDYLTHRQTGQQIKWKGKKDGLKYLLSVDPYWVHTVGYEPSIEYTTYLQNEPMYNGNDPFGIDDYPCVPFLWIMRPQYNDYRYKIQGMIRVARDPQEEYNKVRSTMVDILRSQPNSGWQIEEGAVKNPKDLTKVGQGQIIEMSPGRSIQAAQKIQPADLSQGIVSLSQQLNTDILQLPGLNEEALGVAEQGNTEISGTLAKMRTANSITILKSAFDKAELTQKLAGQKLLKMMLVNYTPQKLSQIVGRPIPQIDIDKAMKYDIVVKEALLTDTQKTLSYVQALQAKAAGINIPDGFVLQQMPIANKSELMEAYSQEAKQAQEQQAKVNEQEQMQLRLQNSEIVHKLSLAEQQRETAVSRQALAQQHLANSYADRAKGLLDNVKAAKEIQGMEQEQVMKGLAFLLQLQDMAGQKETSQVKDTSQESAKDVVAFNQLNKMAGLNTMLGGSNG